MKKFGQYIITKEIGEGGMGKVYRAWKVSEAGFKKLVAIKILKSSKHTELFINEAKISAKFDHENIVKTNNFGKIENSFFIEMEYVKGINLMEFLKKANEIPLDIFLFISEKILTATEYIHNFEGRRLIHRDINQKNILISWTGGVKLSDFGITLPQNDKIDPFGKLSYVPPEVISGNRWTQQGDIWSIGVVMWEMLTSQRLFSSPNPEEVKTKIIKGSIPPPSSINPIVTEHIDEVVMKALSRNPFMRYNSAEEMLNALKIACEKSSIPQIYQKDFAEFIQSCFSEKIREEEAEIAEEERKIPDLLIENQSGKISNEITEKITPTLNKTQKSNKTSEKSAKKEKTKKHVKRKIKTNIKELSLFFGIFLGFSTGILKSIYEIKKAQEFLKNGTKLISQNNISAGKELIKKSFEISGVKEIEFILRGLENVEQENQQAEKQKNFRKVQKR
ncbi:Serine/threonine-protein kinase PrkC [bacterium HR19]|nr:Serine/threonine-protein kinase PrkC [bacterium HR19]